MNENEQKELIRLLKKAKEDAIYDYKKAIIEQTIAIVNNLPINDFLEHYSDI